MSETSGESLAVFSTIVNYLTKNKMDFRKKDDVIFAEVTAREKDQPVEVRFQAYDKGKVLRVISTLPLNIPEHALEWMPSIICEINDQLVTGSFLFSEKQKRICFLLTQIYKGSLINEETIHYMLTVAFSYIDEYSVKLRRYYRGLYTADEAIRSQHTWMVIT